MAALNQGETEVLRNATRALDYVLRHGYDPTKAEGDDKDPTQVQLKRVLTEAKSGLKTVAEMKGYYPK